MKHVCVTMRVHMMSYRQCIEEAERNRAAVGHFNISNVEALWGIFRAAQKRSLPILIGTSEGERDFLGVHQAVALVRSLREQYDYPIYLNADHTYSFERIKEVVDAGYDSVIIDGAELPLEENVELTKRSVEYARSVNPDILVEAEIGYIGKSSSVFDELPEGAAVTEELLTTPEEAKEFVERTGVDLLAPAVGSVHGMSKKGLHPKLYADRIRDIRTAAGVPLVLHGGSGSSSEDMKEAIAAGITVVHINTEIRLAYRKGLTASLQESPDEIAPYKYLKQAVAEVERVVGEKLDIFSGEMITNQTQ